MLSSAQCCAGPGPPPPPALGVQVNTGLPILKIGWESLLGSLPGGGCVYAVTYLVYAINGGSGQPGVLKVGWAQAAQEHGQFKGACGLSVGGPAAGGKG